MALFYSEAFSFFEYKASIMHAKNIVVDGVWSTIGSTNFDNRSFALNQEINLTVYDSGIAHRLEEIFQEDLKYSQNITYEQWRSRSIFERFFELSHSPSGSSYDIAPAIHQN
jgi:cardiolipin synthase